MMIYTIITDTQVGIDESDQATHATVDWPTYTLHSIVCRISAEDVGFSPRPPRAETLKKDVVPVGYDYSQVLL